MKSALVIGSTGQDGSILCELLLDRGYCVHATHRRSSVDNLLRLEHIRDQLQLHRMDITDSVSVATVIRAVSPDLVFQMADQDHVGWSMTMPGVSFDVTAKGVLNVLEAVRMNCIPEVKVFQPVSATMFGMSPPPQHEETPFDPQSPYAICKLAAYHLCRYYRKKYDMFVSCGIMFNHDSPRRGGDYLLHIIAKQAVEMERGFRRNITLGGDPGTRVDIGCAREFMIAAIQMMEQGRSCDLVIGTGVGYTLKEMVAHAVDRIEKVMYGEVRNRLNRTIIRDEGYDRTDHQPILIADTRLAAIGIGLATKRTSLDVLSELIDFYRKRTL